MHVPPMPSARCGPLLSGRLVLRLAPSTVSWCGPPFFWRPVLLVWAAHSLICCWNFTTLCNARAPVCASKSLMTRALARASTPPSLPRPATVPQHAPPRTPSSARYGPCFPGRLRLRLASLTVSSARSETPPREVMPRLVPPPLLFAWPATSPSTSWPVPRPISKTALRPVV